MLTRPVRLLLCLIASLVAHISFISLMHAALPIGSGGKDVTLQALLTPNVTLIGPVAPPQKAQERTTVADSDAHRDVSATRALARADQRARHHEESLGIESTLTLTPPNLLNDYLPASMLSSLPSPIDSVDPTPSGFRLEGVLGETELLLLISSDGNVDDVLTIHSELPDVFAIYASEAFKRARFVPGKVNNTPVRSRIRVVLSPNPSHVDPETGNPLSAKNRRR